MGFQTSCTNAACTFAGSSTNTHRTTRFLSHHFPDRPLINKQHCALNTFLRVIQTWPQRGFTTRVQALHLSLGIGLYVRERLFSTAAAAFSMMDMMLTTTRKRFWLKFIKEIRRFKPNVANAKLSMLSFFFFLSKKKSYFQTPTL